MSPDRHPDPSQFATFEEFRDSDTEFKRRERDSRLAAFSKFGDPPGRSRKRLASVTAKWANKAEHRQRREKELRDVWDSCEVQCADCPNQCRRTWMTDGVCPRCAIVREMMKGTK